MANLRLHIIEKKKEEMQDYMGDQVVTLAVQFASFPDKTNYPELTVLNAKLKDLVVTTTNSDYRQLTP